MISHEVLVRLATCGISSCAKSALRTFVEELCRCKNVEKLCTDDVAVSSLSWAAKEWSLGCVKRAPAARGGQEAGITQPRDHSLAVPWTGWRNCCHDTACLYLHPRMRRSSLN